RGCAAAGVPIVFASDALAYASPLVDSGAVAGDCGPRDHGKGRRVHRRPPPEAGVSLSGPLPSSVANPVLLRETLWIPGTISLRCLSQEWDFARTRLVEPFRKPVSGSNQPRRYLCGDLLISQL